MKQKIRLTESQLHNVIKECINEALNELDWRTYVSAAKKRAQQYNDYIRNDNFDIKDPIQREKALKLGLKKNALADMAISKSREKFANMDDGYDFYTTIGKDGTIYANADSKDGERSMYGNEKGKHRTFRKTRPGEKNIDPHHFFNYDDNTLNKFNRFEKEIDDFNKLGDEGYTKGKGWD